jgi:anti-sigma factor RsiW
MADYLDENLDEDRREWFRSHLRDCETCCGWAVDQDPTLLFVTSAEPTDDPEKVEACVAAVTGQIRRQRLERRLRGRRRPWLAAAAAATLVVAGGLVWQMVPGAGAPEAPAMAEVEGAAETAPEPPSIEVEMADETVRVYQFAADDDDTAVYFVVNPAMEL